MKCNLFTLKSHSVQRSHRHWFKENQQEIFCSVTLQITASETHRAESTPLWHTWNLHDLHHTGSIYYRDTVFIKVSCHFVPLSISFFFLFLVCHESTTKTGFALQKEVVFFFFKLNPSCGALEYISQKYSHDTQHQYKQASNHQNSFKKETAWPLRGRGLLPYSALLWPQPKLFKDATYSKQQRKTQDGVYERRFCWETYASALLLISNSTSGEVRMYKTNVLGKTLKQINTVKIKEKIWCTRIFLTHRANTDLTNFHDTVIWLCAVRI